MGHKDLCYFFPLIFNSCNIIFQKEKNLSVNLGVKEEPVSDLEDGGLFAYKPA